MKNLYAKGLRICDLHPRMYLQYAYAWNTSLNIIWLYIIMD